MAPVKVRLLAFLKKENQSQTLKKRQPDTRRVRRRCVRWKEVSLPERHNFVHVDVTEQAPVREVFL
jgi:hypothetical protein